MNVVPQYPRGFFIASDPQRVPNGFTRVGDMPNLYAHEWADVSVARSADTFVTIIGECVAVVPSIEGSVAEHLLTLLVQGEAQFFDALSLLSGRYVIIFGTGERLQILNDATGMRSVFYSEGFEVVASHARLVEELLGGKIELRRKWFSRGFPGNWLPFKRTRILTPNTFLDVSKGTVTRFWPLKELETSTVEDEIPTVLDAASIAIRNLSSAHPVKLTLTAGADSRVILACALHSGVAFDTYTYGATYKTARDRALAADLSKLADVSHTVPPGDFLERELRVEIGRANYTKHHWNYVQGLMEWIDNPDTVVLMGLMLEIGRGVTAVNLPDAAAPVDGRSMAELHYQTMPSKVRKKIENGVGREEYLRFSTAAFSDWLATIGGFEAEFLNPFVQFYWEHRMPTWLGPTMAERDFYGAPVSPFNCRMILESMLSVSFAEQESGAIPFGVIERAAPELLQLPVNPPKWPDDLKK
ncbi:hypothetical protein RAE08_10005 [Corynebacterium tuberculostearicum]|uniref:hypothetical protein n=1 Tax=Corynebacterium tuberculostearicum TaxID=38304 RepID=UPI00293531C6|nr:hypothetical protein [Corynebacterium tuberculostearicum]MDV2431455.1 hypothetical protein [Corynebacterium tuberculostearicum]